MSSAGKPSKLQTWMLGLGGLLVFFGLWAAFSGFGLVPARFLPSPAAVAQRMFFLADHPFAGASLPVHVLSSLGRYALGFLLAAAIGVPLGLFMGWYSLLDDIVTPIFNALRFVAPIAWVPFAALWFGTGIGGPVMVIFAGAFPPCLINAYRGAKFVDAKFLEAAHTLGAGNLRIVTEVLLPVSIPSIVSGLRVGAGLGWQSLVGAELIVASSGVGYMMVQGQSAVSTPTVLSGMIAIGIVGYCVDLVLREMEAFTRRRRGLG
ncbi:MAG: ABC transporter permease [Methylobacteriaceae bacterium]|nr:ABC transporter permease [Methylobacteriaceae bacterium]